MRKLVFAPSIAVGVATAIAAFSQPGFVVMFLGILTMGSIAVTAMAYPPVAYVETGTIERLFPDEEGS